MLCAFIFALLWCPDPAWCQSAHALEQTSFQLEEPVKHPAPLPRAVLEKLRAETRDTTCPNSKAATDFDDSWFGASEVTLRRGELPALVVKAENACLWGANIGPFWVFRHSKTGYEIVLSESALGLEVLNTRTNGYRDIQLSAATARDVLTAVYKFKNGKYGVAIKRTKPIGQQGPTSR